MNEVVTCVTAHGKVIEQWNAMRMSNRWIPCYVYVACIRLCGKLQPCWQDLVDDITWLARGWKCL
jgi:hypothetical protein